MKPVVITFRGALFAASLALASPALAEPASTPTESRETRADSVSQGAGDQSASAEEDQVVDANELQSYAGGTGVSASVLTQQNLTAFNSGNVVSGVTVGSGEINIGSNAFSGFDGVGNFVLNTGHNNNLQSSLNVSIVLGQ